MSDKEPQVPPGQNWVYPEWEDSLECLPQLDPGPSEPDLLLQARESALSAGLLQEGETLAGLQFPGESCVLSLWRENHGVWSENVQCS